jgi:methylated-DNA-[protein]-cysteine S-methyltransferase
MRKVNIPPKQGVTPFMMAVYRVVARIGRGQTHTYAQVARAIGRPRAARAVGNALNRNPYPKTMVPCHRVVRSDGTLGGYALGGSKKKALLRGEGALH